MKRLQEAARDGAITLLLGAGTSIPHRVPGWAAVSRAVWRRAFPDEPTPEPPALPIPLALELCARKLEGEAFVQVLKDALYSEVKPLSRRELGRSHESLAVVARTLIQEQARGAHRRIQRVISFNADDLLEQAVGLLAPRGARVLKTIVRASQHPERGLGTQPIPVYHLHGYLPQRAGAEWHHGAPDSLVFTDAQYWSSVAEPSSFANRVMQFALHDSRCVFLGLSMTDLNLMRWLALRTLEVEADKVSQFSRGKLGDVRRATRRALDRHFWIRPEADDPAGCTARWLQIRGVTPVTIRSWADDSLEKLFAECFAS